ncbi:tryptophan 2,3-dioxygenase family protein [Pelagibius marinus]|uniref:tryptophan 2,3-dioxygenase family protein n=1 Tax=Pelagibius marinus TaxID=2762760 RepID=UPI001872A1D1|nr:tryptophan 2,3-dioxygenase family protein [Pelagibius marinus]
MSEEKKPLYYADYLQLDRLLGAQAPESVRLGKPAHDEMLFIVVHQAYELWFKQILHEMTRIDAIFAAENLDDRDIGRAVAALERIERVLKLLIAQLDVLETMTPLDFLEFRDLLFPSSGFQSLQFRLIEMGLGLRRQDRIGFEAKPFDARLSEADRAKLREAEKRPNLSDRIEAWLERTPFVELGGYKFQEAYRAAVARMLDQDTATLRGSAQIAEEEKTAGLAALEAARVRFEAIYDEARHAELVKEGAWRLSWRALQAALFINLYRDEPVLQLPFRLLSLLMDIDETMTAWRYRHALMAQRMIGMKLGTGGSSGHDYLAEAARRYRVFGDLFALSTFLIPRSALPPLPEPLRNVMGYSYSAGRP